MISSLNIDFTGLAQAAGVSQTAVWRMMFIGKGGLKADEIARAQRVINQLPPDCLSAERTALRPFSILVIMPYLAGLSDFGGQVLHSFKAAARQVNYEIVCYEQTKESVADLVSLISAFQCVLMLVSHGTRALINACAAARRPYVLIEADHVQVGPGSVTINADNRQAVREVTAHLISLGHRRVGFVGGPAGHPSAEERLAGYRETLEANGIPCANELVFEGDWQEPAGHHGAEVLLGLPDRPTAILAANDMMAYGVVRAARALGFGVPADLSVTGFDDLSFSADFTPPLTTVHQRTGDISQQAFQCVRAFQEGQSLSSQAIRMSAELIVRASTAPPPYH